MQGGPVNRLAPILFTQHFNQIAGPWQAPDMGGEDSIGAEFHGEPPFEVSTASAPHRRRCFAESAVRWRWTRSSAMKWDRYLRTRCARLYGRADKESIEATMSAPGRVQSLTILARALSR